MSGAPAMTIFSPAQLDQIVAETIPKALPENHHNAIVATVDTQGAKVAALFSKSTAHGTWQFKTAGEFDWNGDRKVGAEVIDSW